MTYGEVVDELLLVSERLDAKERELVHLRSRLTSADQALRQPKGSSSAAPLEVPRANESVRPGSRQGSLSLRGMEGALPSGSRRRQTESQHPSKSGKQPDIPK